MTHIAPLIFDLALLLFLSGLISVLFKKFKQPAVLGFIVAGYLAGPAFHYLPNVSDLENIKVWGEIGMIFLLFSLGLEFNFKKIGQLGSGALINAVIELLGMMTLGFIVGRLFGWRISQSVFLGGVLAISSTAIITRSFDEFSLKQKRFSQLVMGVLILEDILGILLLVLLPAFAATGKLEGDDLIESIARFVFFIVLWFILGLYFIPTFFRKFSKQLHGETLLLVTIGLCFGMAVLASYSGLSAALGAFMVGSLLSETGMTHQIEEAITPLRQVFTGVFFVSVGLLIRPDEIGQAWWQILVLALVVILGKFLFVAIGAMVSGQKPRVAAAMGLSMGQIGEFAFIITSLGMTLGVVHKSLSALAVMVAILTSVTSSFSIKYYEKIIHLLSRYTPAVIKNGVHNWQSKHLEFWGRWSPTADLQWYLFRTLTHSVLAISMFILGDWLAHVVIKYFEFTYIARSTLGYSLGLIMAGPFLWALLFSQPGGRTLGELLRLPDRRKSVFAGQVVRWLGFFMVFSTLISKFISLLAGAGFISFIILLAVFVFLIGPERVYLFFEKRFIHNLTQESRTRREGVSLWDVHLTEVQVPANSVLVPFSLGELDLRKKFGVSVVTIRRGDLVLEAPSQEERILPLDYLTLVGSDDDLDRFVQQLEKSIEWGKKQENVILNSFVIYPNSRFCNKAIGECGLRELTGGLIVGHDHEGNRTKNPSPDIVLQPYDIVWVVGDPKILREAFKEPL